MRVLHVLLLVLLSCATVARSMSYDRMLYENLLSQLERQRAVRSYPRDFVMERPRRSSEKKSYPRNCYFSPIQCLFTRS